MISEGIKSSFKPDSDGIEVTGKAFDVDSAISMINRKKVDVILLDLYIRNHDPVKNLKILQKEFPSIPVIIISVDKSLESQVMMFREGVKGYYWKSDFEGKMKNLIFQVSDGYAVIPNEVMNVIDLGSETTLIATLTADEKEMLTYLSCGDSIQDIADKMFKTASSIEKILSEIRHRFHAKSNCEMLTILLRLKAV